MFGRRIMDLGRGARPTGGKEAARKPPETYAQWCELFDEITRSPRDEAYVDIIAAGSVSWTSGVAERFVRSAAGVIGTRIDAALDSYQRQMKNARGIDNNLSGAFTTLKREYRYVYRLASALPIPAEHRDQLVKMVQDQADRTQKSLEDSAKSDRTGHLLNLVRNAHINKLS